MTEPSATPPQPNEAAARTPTGELINQAAPPTEPNAPKDGTTPAPTGTNEPKSTELAKEPGKDGEKPKSEAAATVPDKYEFKLPEGATIDEATQAEASELLKGIGASQETANKLMDWHLAQVKKTAEANINLVKEQNEKWRSGVINDSTLGDGKGLKPAVAATIAKGIDALGALATPFREAMDSTGMGNHPDIVRGIHAFAQRVTEGTHVSGKGASPAGQKETQAPRSAAEAMYPHLAPRNS